jgi:hypothetical protein
MTVNATPAEIGQWYARADKGGVFRVVGCDEESRTIEIQSIDGDIDEIDGDTWATLPLEVIEAPEEGIAPLDDAEADDLGYSDAVGAQEWLEP